jgi:hypothetical protein
MRPSGSGATGKGMGLAAECRIRRKGGILGRWRPERGPLAGPLSCRGQVIRILSEPGVTRLGVVPADRISEDYSVRGDLELADLGVVGACA